MTGSPLEQFVIVSLVPFRLTDGLGLSFTNSALAMVVSALLVAAGTVFGCRNQSMVPGRVQAIVELSYQFIAGLIHETIGKRGRKYFPLIFSLFFFILFGNLLGMLPYSFVFTSHIIVTMALALLVFIGVTFLGFWHHGFRFFSFFVPPGAPKWMWPLLIPIEIISYLSRPISLSVRLFANMLAGHTLMKVIASFVAILGLAGVFPFALLIALTGLEILIAFLQAYVFAILTCLYINDALHLH